MPEAPAAVFLNRAAGSAGSRSVSTAVDAVRGRLNADLHEIATRDPGELGEWLAARIGPYRIAVVVGGDGSLGVAMNVAAGRDVTLAYIPAGFGNAAAHLLRLPRDPGALAELVARGEARAVDLVAVDGRLALFAGAGWDAVAARRYAAGRASGMAGWAVAIGRSLPDARRHGRVRVVADGRPIHEGPMQLLVVSTTPFYGRGLLINPGARPDAGRLVLRVYDASVIGMVVHALRWASRRTPSAPGIAARWVEVRSADGRPLPVQADGDHVGERERWRFEIRPRAVRLVGRWA